MKFWGNLNLLTTKYTKVEEKGLKELNDKV